MWAYRIVTEPIDVFDFAVIRRRDGPGNILSGFGGTILADCYAAASRPSWEVTGESVTRPVWRTRDETFSNRGTTMRRGRWCRLCPTTRAAAMARICRSPWTAPIRQIIPAKTSSGLNRMLRFHLQNAVKAAFRLVGCEIRYAFQYPRISDRSIYGPWFDGAKVKTILDVGANVGQSGAKFATAFPTCTVHCFEPFAESYSRLAAVAKRSNGRIRSYQLACGDRESTVQAHYVAAAGSQLQRIDAATSRLSDQTLQTINVVTLDRWCAENRIESVDILKTDTEGYDTKVLMGAERLLSEGRVKCVVSEVGFLGDNHHSPIDSIYPFLIARGFGLAGIFEVTYRQDRTCDFANALFVYGGKDGESPSGHSG